MQFFFSLLVLVVLFVLCYGWGRIAGRLLFGKRYVCHHITSLWLGWLFLLGLLQGLHLFFPVNHLISLSIACIGVFFSYSSLSTKALLKFRDCCLLWRQGLAKYGFFIKKYFGLVFLVGLGILVMARTLGAAWAYDAGLYYLQAIQWNSAYSIVPGLGNLIGQLAFNTSHFLFASFLNFFPYYSHGFLHANPFLYLLAFLTFLDRLRPLFEKPSLLLKANPLRFLPTLFLLPYFLHLLFLPAFMDGMLSAAPDVAVNLLELIIFLLCADMFLELFENSEANFDFLEKAILLLLLSAGIVTIKLSAAVFALCAFALAGFSIFLRLQRKEKILTWKNFGRPVFLAVLCSALLVATWSMGVFLMSGYFVYPSVFLSLPMEWAIPKEHVSSIQNWIYSWARQPGVSWQIVLADWAWFRPWLGRFVFANLLNAVYPLLLSIANIFLLVCLGLIRSVVSIKRRFSKQGSLEESRHSVLWYFRYFLLAVFPVPSLVFWFFTAPDPRFALPLFAVFLVSSTLSLLGLMYESKPKDRFSEEIAYQDGSAQKTRNAGAEKEKMFWQKLFLSFFPRFPLTKKFLLGLFLWVQFGFFLFVYIQRKDFKKKLIWVWPAFPKVELVKSHFPSGHTVYFPKTGDQCWNAPLPCLPQAPASLDLRNPMDISEGFRSTYGR